MYVPAISVALLAGYTCCLLWALSGASRATLAALAALVVLALTLRLIYPHEYPWGMHQDEVHVAIGALRAYCYDLPRLVMTNNLQGGLYAATIGPLYGPLGPWWAARSYSVIATVIAVPLAWGTARSLGFASAAALAGVAVPFAAFPWALAYGRTGIGGEVILNALVVLFALSKCATARGWRLAAAGTLLCFGLGLCLYGYTAGKVLLVIAAVGTVTFPRDLWLRRALVVALACTVALLAYASFSGGRYAWYGFDASMLPEASRPLAVWRTNLVHTLAFLWRPIDWTTCSQSLSSAVVLPLPFLFLAAFGVAAGMRRRVTWLLLIAFALGLLPTLFGANGISSRRLLPAAMIVPFFIGMALDWVGTRWRPLVAGTVAGAVFVWGPMTFFGEHFWMSRDKLAFCDIDCSLLPDRGPIESPTGCGDLGAGFRLGKSS